MANEREHFHHSRAPVFGIFLVFIGIILLLQTFNVISWSLWDTLWHFWPVIIIIIGLAILLRNYNVWLISLLTVVVLSASLGIALWQNSSGVFTGGVRTVTYVQPLENLRQAGINIDFTAGHLSASSLASNSSNLIEARVDATNSESSLKASFSGTGSNGQLSLNSINQQLWPTSGINWNLNFTPDIPLSFSIENSASSADYDFSSMRISGVDLDLNAGSCNMNLPEPSGIIPVKVTDNAASIDITIPGDAAAMVHATTNVGSLDLSSRFVKQGNDWMTPNYNNASNRIEFQITTNVGSVHIH